MLDTFGYEEYLIEYIRFCRWMKWFNRTEESLKDYDWLDYIYFQSNAIGFASKD